jgi:predicted 3-demethylubiquinone-9 3-methyltransferase (glyoxalase superfamily)
VGTITKRVTPFLWFNNEAEEAANFYVSIFPNSKVATSIRYGADAAKMSGQKEGTVMTIAFELDGCAFTALNGGPLFRFTEAVSFVVNCKDQTEIDHYWNALSKGGDPNAQQCGWLKDKYGLSWQIVPVNLPELLTGPKAMQAMLQMKKLDIAALRDAAK